MGTVRVSRSTGAPSTDFTVECDWVGQSQAGNYSTLRVSIKAVNRGYTGSYSNYQGSQTARIDGVGAPSHSGILPSGVGTDVTRWNDGPWNYNVKHDANGYLGALTVRQIISGWFSYDDSGTIPAPARIIQSAPSPNKPVATEITPTSMRISWTVPANTGGALIEGYLLRRYEDGSKAYVDNFANNLSRVITGLIPGKKYNWAVYTRTDAEVNKRYSVPSVMLLRVPTLGPTRLKIGGVYKYGQPYVKVAGKYKIALPYVKRAGKYKQSN